MSAKTDPETLARELEDLAQRLRAVALERAELREHGAAVEARDSELRARVRELTGRASRVIDAGQARTLRGDPGMRSQILAMARANRTPETAAHPWVIWLDARGLTIADWAERQRPPIDRITASHWGAGRRMPPPSIQARIEAETNRAVPASVWAAHMLPP